MPTTYMAIDPAETLPVEVTVLGLDLVHAPGRLLALAAVEIDIDGIVLGLDGVRVVRLGPHRHGVEPPVWRAGAQSRPAVILPAELTAAIAGAVLDLYEASRADAARARAAAPGARLTGASLGAAVIAPPPAETPQRLLKSIFGAAEAQRA